MSDMPEQMTGRNRSRVITAIKIGITILGLYLVTSKLDVITIAELIRQVNSGWMALGVFLMILSLFVRAFRWRVILRGVGSTIRYSRLVELYLVGSFFNAFLPSGLGGDIVRAAEVAQDTDSSVAVGSVLVDRLTGLMALFGMALVALPFRPPNFPAELTRLIGVICVAGLVGGLFIIDGRLLRALLSKWPQSMRNFEGGFIDRLTRSIDECGWPALLAALAISVGFNLIQVAWWATTGLALGLDIPFGYYLLIVPLMALALLIPSIGGLGVREWLAPALFAGAAVAPEAAVALALLVFFLERVASLLGGPVYLIAIIRSARGGRHNDQPIHGA